MSAPGGNRRERRGGAARSSTQRYPTVYRRDALAPGLLGAVALLAGIALLDTDVFVVIRFAASILALIALVFTLQARQWWWVPLLAAVAVVWNPIVPLPFTGQGWALAQLAGAAAFIAVGLTVKRPDPGDRSG